MIFSSPLGPWTFSWTLILPVGEESAQVQMILWATPDCAKEDDGKKKKKKRLACLRATSNHVTSRQPRTPHGKQVRAGLRSVSFHMRSEPRWDASCRPNGDEMLMKLMNREEMCPKRRRAVPTGMESASRTAGRADRRSVTTRRTPRSHSWTEKNK